MLSLLVIFFCVSIVFSFLCSMWEAVLLSITPSFAQAQQQDGTALGQNLADFKKNIDRPLAAILTLNTIAHTVGAIGVGNQAAAIWANANPMITLFVIPAGMTLAILVLSEIIPKTLGATHWRTLAPFTVRSLRIVGALMLPFVLMSQYITRFLKPPEGASVLSRSDFLAMADLGESHGVLEKTESDTIRSLLQFSEVTARDIMTPRTVVLTADEHATAADFRADNEPLSFSRIPCHASGEPEHVTGYVLKDELLEALVDGDGERQIESFRRPILTVNEDSPLPELFDRLISKREHIAVVIDSFGGLSGIVTVEDVIETLLGLEIVDESDASRDMQALARKLWERRAKGLAAKQTTQDNKA